MINNDKYVDVNRDAFLNIWMREVQGDKMVNFDEKAKLVHDFVLRNPSNPNKVSYFDTLPEEMRPVKFSQEGIGINSDNNYIIERTKRPEIAKTKSKKSKKKKKK